MHRFLPLGLCALIAAAPAAEGQTSTTTRRAPHAAPAPAIGRAAAPVRSATPSILPGTGADAFVVIKGTALDAASAALPDSFVRLRDARLGRILDAQLTDQAGLFEFRTVDPGSYVIELLGADHSVLAASQLLHVNAGQAVSAVVKLPLPPQAVGGLLGHAVHHAAAVVSAAAASGLLTIAVVGVDATPRVP